MATKKRKHSTGGAKRGRKPKAPVQDVHIEEKPADANVVEVRKRRHTTPYSKAQGAQFVLQKLN